MASLKQCLVPATYMRGGTSKGVFFKLDDLPEPCQKPGPCRDALFMRVVGSPDPYANHVDGMGGATSSTSKCVIVNKSAKQGHDIDYLYGQVAIGEPFVDWSGNCGNLSAAAAAFAIHSGFIEPSRIPENGICTVTIYQANIGQTIVAHVPVCQGQVQELGDFKLDGVAFNSAEIVLEFLQPVAASEKVLPTGCITEQLQVPGMAPLTVSLINAGIATVFVNAIDIGYQGTELREDINNSPKALAMLEQIRVAAALKMGLIKHPDEAKTRQHTPKVAFVAPPKNYQSASGELVSKDDIDLLVRALSMGKLHHAMMGTCAVAIAVAAAIEGTVVNQAAGGKPLSRVCFGHPSGSLSVGALVKVADDAITVEKASMSRSARILFSGHAHLPCSIFESDYE